MHPGLLLLSLKGLIFYKVFNTQQEESRSFAFSYFLSCLLFAAGSLRDKAKQLNDKSSTGANAPVFLYSTELHFAFPAPVRF